MDNFSKIKNINFSRKLIIFLVLFLFNSNLSIIYDDIEIFYNFIIFISLLFLIEIEDILYFYLRHRIIKYKNKSFLNDFILSFILYETMFLISYIYPVYILKFELEFYFILFIIAFYLLLRLYNLSSFLLYNNIDKIKNIKREIIENYFYDFSYIIFTDLDSHKDKILIKFKSFYLEFEDEKIYFECKNKKLKLNSLLNYLKINNKKLENLNNDDLNLISVFDY
jgi:hypothetical protein